MCDKTYIEFTLNLGYLNLYKKIFLVIYYIKKNCYLCEVIFVILLMNNLFKTYSNSVISFADAEESLLVIFTPPLQIFYNQIFSCSSTV